MKHVAILGQNVIYFLGAVSGALCNRLTQSQIGHVLANISMPKYSGKPEELDESKRTCNKCINDSTIGCKDAQR